MYYPSRKAFKAKARLGNLIPVYREVLADTETAVSAFLKIKGSQATLSRPGVPPEQRRISNPLDLVKEVLSIYRPAKVEGLPRFFGGMVGYLSYDTIRFFEALPDRTEDDLALPDALFMLTDTLLIF